MRRALPSLFAASLLLAGCGGGGEPRRQPTIDEQDRQIGAEQHPALLQQFGGEYRGPQAAYVAGLGERLAGAAGLGGQCRFTLVNSDVVNAFAVPGCYIYVTRGLMALVNSEAELGSVLGHELGHIVADHSGRQQSRSVWRSIGVLAVGLITGSDRLTQIAGNAAQLFDLRYSRAQEYESDDLGIDYMVKAGLDPHATPDMLSALGRQEAYLTEVSGRDAARGVPEWVRTHPLTQNRIDRARKEAEATGLADDQLPENEGAYLRAVDGMLYGDDPEQGFVLGRAFAHPIMRIAFHAPEGFTLTNSPSAIGIEAPGGVRGEFGGGQLGPGGLDEYATRLMEEVLRGASARVGQAERSTVNGLPAIFVPAGVRSRDGEAQLSVAVYAAPDGGAYHFIMMAPADADSEAAIRALFGSFRMLSAAEAAKLPARRIAVVTASARDDEASLAARMAADHPAALFRVINDRREGQPVRPGEPVKLVIAGR